MNQMNEKKDDSKELADDGKTNQSHSDEVVEEDEDEEEEEEAQSLSDLREKADSLKDELTKVNAMNLQLLARLRSMRENNTELRRRLFLAAKRPPLLGGKVMRLGLFLQHHQSLSRGLHLGTTGMNLAATTSFLSTKSNGAAIEVVMNAASGEVGDGNDNGAAIEVVMDAGSGEGGGNNGAATGVVMDSAIGEGDGNNGGAATGVVLLDAASGDGDGNNGAATGVVMLDAASDDEDGINSTTSSPHPPFPSKNERYA